MTLETHRTLVTRFASLFEQSTLLQTHISSLVITPERVYKFKKPVDFGFLDYTSLAKRKHFCEEEVRLGSLGAPGLYIGVIPVYGDAERPALEPLGPPLEYAVCMHRFDEESQLDCLLESDRLHSAQIDAITDKLVKFHRDAEPSPPETPFGTPETVLGPMLENFDHLYLLPEAERGMLETLRSWITGEHKRLTPLIQKRKESGRVRECHGDLHLRNMALYKGEIIFFDPIEFDDRLRHIDTISDLAFLLMDLKARENSELARRLLTLYLEESGEYEGVALLPLYQVYRAMVRAKVAALRLTQVSDPAEKGSIIRESRHYLDLALSFLHKAPVFLALMHGFSASGKSAAALRLAERTGAIRLRSDRERPRLFAQQKGRYGCDATERTYGRLAELARALLSEGERVVVDATFLAQRQRELFCALAQKLGVRFFILHVQAPQSLLYERLTARGEKERDISEATPQVLRRQLTHHEPLQKSEEKYVIILHTQTPERLEEDMEKWLGELED